MTNSNLLITNCNGRFYAGMTLKEAQLKGVDKCTFRRDFYNLDKDGDGVLSVREVMQERERDARIEKYSALAFASLGLLDYVTSKSKGERAFWIGIDALLGAFSWYNYNKINNETKKYNEMLANRGDANINIKA